MHLKGISGASDSSSSPSKSVDSFARVDREGYRFKFSAGERISRVSIKGRSGWKDKVSTPISILVSKRVFNRRHARTCVANDMRRAAARKNRWDMRGSCTREFFRAVHLLLFFIENALRDANLFTLERNNLNLPKDV